MVKGKYISRETAVVSAHAAQRYVERIRPVGNAAQSAIAAFLRARLLVSVNWWNDDVTSYWIDHRDRVLFVVSCRAGQLCIVTIMRAEGDAHIQNRRAMIALKNLRKKWRER